MEIKQTAVEWLDRWFRDNPEATHDQGNKALLQAKEMEKKQISKAWDDGDHAYFYSKQDGTDFENGTEYYNEIYGKENDRS